MANRRKRSRRVAERQAVGASQVSSDGDESLGTGRDWWTSFSVLLGVICSIALFLRLIHVLQTVEVPTIVQLLGDAKGYFDWAMRIAGGQWYGTETFYQAPLYPYTLAVLIKFLGSGVLGIRLVQACLGAASAVLVAIAAKNIFHSAPEANKIGAAAGVMYAVYPPAIYFDGIIQKTALASFLLCALLAVVALLGRSDRFQFSTRGWLSVLVGVILGLLVLTRENSLLWVPLFPVWIWLGLSLARKHRAILIVCYVGGLAAVLLPVAARNASLGGEWSPTTFQAGPNFYIGNNLESNGLYRPLIPGHETPMFERADAQRLAEQAEGRELTSREVSKFWAQRSLEEIKQDPARWLQLMVLKSLMVINRYEVPDIECMYVYSDFSWPLRALSPIWHFGLLCPLAVWGIAATRHQWRELWVYYLLIVVMALAVVLFFILGRYRQPLVPLLVLFAAPGLIDIAQRLWRRLRKEGPDDQATRPSRSIRIPLIATAIALVACNIKVHDESMLLASSYMNLGIAAGQSGNMAVSLPALARAVQAHPEMPEAHMNLGRALDLTNRPREAIVCYQNALLLDAPPIMVDSLLAASYERIGDIENAIRHYRRAAEIDPTDEISRNSLRRLLEQQ